MYRLKFSNTPKAKKRQKQQKNKFKKILMAFNCKIMNKVKDMLINIVEEKICKGAHSLPCNLRWMRWICF
jgi:hypothetical protein